MANPEDLGVVSSVRLATVLYLAIAIGTTTFIPARAEGKRALPGQPCSTEALDEWSPQEKWVWQSVCEGRVADFNKRHRFSITLDPKNPKGWLDSRILTPDFLRTILLYEPFRSALTEEGVVIEGAWFREKIDLSGAEIHQLLALHWSRLDQGACLRGLRSQNWLSLIGSAVSGALDMDGAEVRGSLIMNQGEFREVVLRSAKIDGQVDMHGSTFSGSLDMDFAKVGNLVMSEKAQFQHVVLREMTIGGSANLDGSVFSGNLEMDGAEIGNLFMGHGARFGNVHLHGAKIGGQLDMDGATISGRLSMDSAEIGRDLFMRRADLTKASPVALQFLSVEGNLDLRDARLKELDLRGATVAGELRLADSTGAPTWEPDSRLDLRHTRAGRFQALGDQANLASVGLAGFIYDALGGFAEGSERSNAELSADFIESWLRKEEVHSPQAHEHFALTLRKMGLHQRADQTLYEGKHHEFWNALRSKRVLGAGWFFVQYVFIGYGHRVWYALLWIAGLIVAGWWSARKSGARLPNSEERLGFWYSVDRLLPIVELRKRHYEVDLNGWPRVYFYFHTMMGYLLATFLLAALSGLVG